MRKEEIEKLERSKKDLKVATLAASHMTSLRHRYVFQCDRN